MDHIGKDAVSPVFPPKRKIQIRWRPFVLSFLGAYLLDSNVILSMHRLDIYYYRGFDAFCGTIGFGFVMLLTTKYYLAIAEHPKQKAPGDDSDLQST